MLWKTFIVFVMSISSVIALSSVKVPKYLAVYYGWPSLVQNSQGNLTKASDWFKQFDLIVFGDGIWKTSHGDHANTVIIIGNLIADQKKVFGYVDLGVSTQNLTEEEMRTAVDGWSAMGVNVRLTLEKGFSHVFVYLCRGSFGMMLALIMV